MTYTEILESLDEQITEAREQTGRVSGAGARYFALKGLREYAASLPDIRPRKTQIEPKKLPRGRPPKLGPIRLQNRNPKWSEAHLNVLKEAARAEGSMKPQGRTQWARTVRVLQRFGLVSVSADEHTCSVTDLGRSELVKYGLLPTDSDNLA